LIIDPKLKHSKYLLECDRFQDRVGVTCRCL